MTEAEWLAADDPARLLGWLRGRAGPRKLRLFAAACCRRAAGRLPGGPGEAAAAAAERVADGRAGPGEWAAALLAARRALRAAGNNTRYGAAAAAVAALARAPSPDAAARLAADAADAAAAAAEPAGRWAGAAERASQADLLRDLFGNPFRPVRFDPRWRTADVLGVARAVYAGRAFDRLPVLADALMDAGCEDEEVIGHCRGLGSHVRGCWVVDLALGKE